MRAMPSLSTPISRIASASLANYKHLFHLGGSERLVGVRGVSLITYHGRISILDVVRRQMETQIPDDHCHFWP